MAEPCEPDELIRRAAAGDHEATSALLEQYRAQLRRMVAARIDRRVAVRTDPSDVVQEALTEAAEKLPAYLREQPIPLYPWLRRLAWERLIQLHRRHIDAQRRSVSREQHELRSLPAESSVELVGRLMAAHTGPVEAVIREELLARMRVALAALPELDREVLVMRYLEQIATQDIAEVLGISPGAVSMRHLRAIERIRDAMGSDLLEQQP